MFAADTFVGVGSGVALGMRVGAGFGIWVGVAVGAADGVSTERGSGDRFTAPAGFTNAPGTADGFPTERGDGIGATAGPAANDCISAADVNSPILRRNPTMRSKENPDRAAVRLKKCTPPQRDTRREMPNFLTTTNPLRWRLPCYPLRQERYWQPGDLQ